MTGKLCRLAPSIPYCQAILSLLFLVFIYLSLAPILARWRTLSFSPAHARNGQLFLCSSLFSLRLPLSLSLPLPLPLHLPLSLPLLSSLFLSPSCSLALALALALAVSLSLALALALALALCLVLAVPLFRFQTETESRWGSARLSQRESGG